MGQFVALNATQKQRGSTAVIASPTQQVREVIVLARIDLVVPVFDTVESALSPAARTPRGVQ
jgi:anti-anti-sigma regulatory factor